MIQKLHRFFRFIAISFILSIALGANIHAAPSQDDVAVEARLKALSSELRCLVCQNTTLADSNAPLAEDLRKEIRVLMREGKNDEEVVAYLVERYGDFVRYRPPMQANTALLWIGPFVMLLIGAITLFVVLKKRASAIEVASETTTGDERE